MGGVMASAMGPQQQVVQRVQSDGCMGVQARPVVTSCVIGSESSSGGITGMNQYCVGLRSPVPSGIMYVAVVVV